MKSLDGMIKDLEIAREKEVLNVIKFTESCDFKDKNWGDCIVERDFEKLRKAIEDMD